MDNLIAYVCKATQGDTIDSVRQTPKKKKTTLNKKRRTYERRTNSQNGRDTYNNNKRNVEVTGIFIVSLRFRVYYDGQFRFRLNGDHGTSVGL